MHATHREGERTHEQVLPVVGERGRIDERPERGGCLEPVSRALDRVGERRIRVVAHVRNTSGTVVRRRKRRTSTGRGDRVAEAIERLDLRVVRDPGARAGELDATCGGEWIRGTHGGLVDEDARQDQILGRPGAAPEIAGDVRGVLQRAEVVPAVLQVLVDDLAADVLDLSVGRDADTDLLVAELIAEQEGHATRHAGAERPARRDAKGRLADGVEREARLVGQRGEVRSRNESGEGILEILRDGGPARRVAGRQHGGGGDSRAQHHRLAARARGIESVDRVPLILEYREEHAPRGGRHAQCR